MKTFLWHRAFIFLLFAYWAISLYALDTVPRVYEDEPWQASVGAKLAAQGVLGSDLFEGYHEMEQHYFGFMPLFPILLAGVFRFADAGLFQARFVTVSGGLVVLVLTYSLAMRLWRDTRVGIVAAALLLTVRMFAVTPLHTTGILFLDAVRVVRYDIFVPVFGLAALNVYLSARREKSLRLYAFAGFLCALATLTHLYGAFFFVIVICLMMWERLPQLRTALFALLDGFVAPCLTYALYVFNFWEAWRAQTRLYGERFDLLNGAWYLNNLLRESSRYDFGISLENWWTRPGVLLALGGIGLVLVSLGNDALRQKNFGARVILIALVVLGGGFALLIFSKFRNYLVTLTPFAAVAFAWGGVKGFEIFARSNKRLAFVSMFVICVLLLGESSIQLARFVQVSRSMTLYAMFIANVQQFIPQGARVVGMHHYGFGWENYVYRSIAVPLLLTEAAFEAAPTPLGKGLDAQRPDFVLVDARMRAYLENDTRGNRAQFLDWFAARNAERVGSVNDGTYGLIEIFRVSHEQ